jgi:uncharacterized delta-60 repeat protein
MGTELTNPGPGDVAVQPDGKIVWVGAGQIPGDTNTADNFAVARFTATGALDPTFGAGGLASSSFPAEPVSDAANTVLIQPDGKILVGGQAGISRRSIELFAAMLRLNADGSLDTTFGTGGKVVNTANTLAITALGLDPSGPTARARRLPLLFGVEEHLKHHTPPVRMPCPVADPVGQRRLDEGRVIYGKRRASNTERRL